MSDRAVRERLAGTKVDPLDYVEVKLIDGELWMVPVARALWP